MTVLLLIALLGGFGAAAFTLGWHHLRFRRRPVSAEVIVSGVAGVVIPPGVLCETYSSGGKILVRPVQDTRDRRGLVGSGLLIAEAPKDTEAPEIVAHVEAPHAGR